MQLKLADIDEELANRVRRQVDGSMSFAVTAFGAYIAGGLCLAGILTPFNMGASFEAYSVTIVSSAVLFYHARKDRRERKRKYLDLLQSESFKLSPVESLYVTIVGLLSKPELGITDAEASETLRQSNRLLSDYRSLEKLRLAATMVLKQDTAAKTSGISFATPPASMTRIVDENRRAIEGRQADIVGNQDAIRQSLLALSGALTNRLLGQNHNDEAANASFVDMVTEITTHTRAVDEAVKEVFRLHG